MTEQSSADPSVSFPPTPVLVVVDAFIEPEHEEDFNHWYDEKHLPAIVGCPGVRIGARFRSSDDKERKYTTLYVIDDEKVMEGEEISKIRGWDHLTPYVRYERRIFRPVSSFSAASGELMTY